MLCIIYILVFFFKLKTQDNYSYTDSQKRVPPVYHYIFTLLFHFYNWKYAKMKNNLVVICANCAVKTIKSTLLP